MSISGIAQHMNLNYFIIDQTTNSENASLPPKQVPAINEINTHRENLMADNFLDPNKEKATYATVMQQLFQTRDIVGAKRAVFVSLAAAEIPAVDFVSKNSSENTITHTSEGYYSRANQAEITESSEDYLKSEREKLEEAVQGTPATGDAQGVPAEAAATSDSGSASTSEAAAASVDVTV